MNTQIPMPVNGISTPFSIDENIAKMKQTLDNDELVKHKLAVLNTCPTCKRQNSLEKTADMESNMRVKLALFDHVREIAR